MLMGSMLNCLILVFLLTGERQSRDQILRSGGELALVAAVLGGEIVVCDEGDLVLRMIGMLDPEWPFRAPFVEEDAAVQTAASWAADRMSAATAEGRTLLAQLSGCKGVFMAGELRTCRHSGEVKAERERESDAK